MKKSDKILLLLISLAGLFLSACVFSLFYPIPYIYDTVTYYQSVFPWLNYVFAGYAAFILLCSFMLIIVTVIFPGKSNFLIIKKSAGSILFSKKAIESAVRYSYSGLNGINSSSVKVKIRRKPEKTKVFVKLSLNNTVELAPLTEEIQEKIAQTLQSSLGVMVKAITIKVTEYSTESKKEDSEAENV